MSPETVAGNHGSSKRKDGRRQKLHWKVKIIVGEWICPGQTFIGTVTSFRWVLVFC